MEISLAAETIGHIGSIPITNSMLTSWIATILLAGLGFFAVRNIKLIPKGIQNFFELVIEFLINTVDSVIDDKEQSKKYFPFLATIFLFIITNNWLGLLPGVGTIGLHEGSKFIPLFRAGNADLNTTLALAIIAVIMIQIFGILAIGFFRYFSRFINLKSPIDFFVGILEIISEFSRIISFSFRLFGNIFAGEVLLAVIAMLVPYIAPLPFYALEIFVGFIQALVFTMLALVFIKAAITDHTAEAH
jgi:F-type H+-transporting ATPase subunit a